MDSYADTIVVGRNTIVLSYTDKVCEVSLCTDDYEPIKDVPIVSAATSNEALWMLRLDHSLINPNQLRHNRVEVQDDLFANPPMTVTSERDGFTAYLESTGTTIFFKTWTPCQRDLEMYPHIQLSSPEPWDSQNIVFPSYSLSE